MRASLVVPCDALTSIVQDEEGVHLGPAAVQHLGAGRVRSRVRYVILSPARAVFIVKSSNLALLIAAYASWQR